jgi:hypothetical protein
MVAADSNAASATENTGKEIKLQFLPVTRQEGSAITISAESPSVVIDSKSIQFRFDLRNAESAARAEGRLYIIAALESENGKRTYISEPRTIRVGADGRASNPERGVRFSISNFHHREFKLVIPSGGSVASAYNGLRIVELTLVLVDKSGAESLEYRAPANVSLASRS